MREENTRQRLNQRLNQRLLKGDVSLYSVGVILFLFAALATLVIAAMINTTVIQAPPAAPLNLGVMVLATVTIPLFIFLGLVKDHPHVLNTYFWIILFSLVLINLSFDLIPLKKYGDAGYLPRLVDSNQPFSRWLAGSALLGWVFHLTESIAITISVNTFVKVAGALCMTLISIAALNRHKNQYRLAILFPLLSPIWLIFLSGYDEYYPFIAGLWLTGLCVILFGKDEPHPAVSALLIASMPLFYIGFAPLSIILLLRCVINNPKSSLYTILLSAIFYWLGVELFWTGNVFDYLNNLSLELNLGEKNTVFDAYKGHSLSPYSPLFDVNYAVSIEHLSHLVYMQFWGGGWMTPALLLAAVITIGKRRAISIKTFIKEHFFFLAVLGWQTLYFVFMIPKLGPLKDIDLFFSFYIVTAMLTGLGIDKYLANRAQKTTWQYFILSMLAGSSFMNTYQLLLTT